MSRTILKLWPYFLSAVFFATSAAADRRHFCFTWDSRVVKAF